MGSFEEFLKNQTSINLLQDFLNFFEAPFSPMTITFFPTYILPSDHDMLPYNLQQGDEPHSFYLGQCFHFQITSLSFDLFFYYYLPALKALQDNAQ